MVWSDFALSIFPFSSSMIRPFVICTSVAEAPVPIRADVIVPVSGFTFSLTDWATSVMAFVARSNESVALASENPFAALKKFPLTT